MEVSSAPVSSVSVRARARVGRALGSWGRFARARPLGTIGLSVLLAEALVVTLGPELIDLNATSVDVASRLAPPGTPGHLLGTDKLGRDLLSRLILGGRVSLGISVLGTLVAVGAGALLSLIAVYRGGWLDATINRLLEILLAFPLLIMALFIVAVLGTSLPNIVLAIGFAIAPRASRILRPVFLSIKHHDYVTAAIGVGCSELRIMLRHILPNGFAPIIIMVSLDLGAVLIIEASLGFVGLGVPRPTPSWGREIAEGTSTLLVAPWVSALPGIIISLTVLSANTLGDALRDFLDPRLRGLR